jgi:hypothetical protein
MNPSHLKLFLALLWLVPGLGFLAYDGITGQVHALVLGRLRLPLAWVFLLFGAFNLLRWWAGRSARAGRSPLHDRRLRARRRDAETEHEPDPTFRFEEPPPEER